MSAKDTNAMAYSARQIRWRRIGAALGLVVLVTAIVVLVGWLIDAPLLKGVFPGAATMKINTAIGFTLSGTALTMLAVTFSPLRARLAAVCAAVVTLLGTATLVQDLAGVDLGIDDLFGTHTSQRMAPATAVAFTLYGIAVGLRDARFRFARHVAEALSLAVGSIGFIALMGYAYDIPSLYSFYSYSSMAIHTAWLFLLLGPGLLAIRPERGLAAVVVSEHGGGLMARWILPFALGVPFMLGWLRLWGERQGYYGTEFGLTVFASSNIVIFTFLVWLSARTLNRKDAERQRVDEALKISEQRVRDIIDGLGPYMFVGLMTVDGTLVEVNRPALVAAGLKPEDVLGKPVEETYWWNYSDEIKQQLRAAIARAAHGEASRYDVQVRAAENQFIIIDFSIQPLRDRSGKIVFLVPSAIVITERKRAEDALRESEERLRLALDAAHMGTFDWDVPNSRITWSRWHEELWGFKPGEFSGTYEAFAHRVHPDDLPGIETEVNRCIAAREAFVGEFRVVWPDGSLHWISARGEFTFGVDSQALRMRGAVFEITERKQVEAALRESERSLTEAQRIAHVGSWSWNLAGPAQWTDELYRVYGVSPETFTPAIEAFFNLVYPEDRPAMQEWLRACSVGESAAPFEFRAVRPDGTVRFISGRGELIRDAGGRPIQMVGTAQDLTERKQAEEALHVSEERMRLAVTGAGLGTWHWDIATGELVWSEQCLAIFGLALDTVMSYDKFLAALHPEDRESVDGAVRRALDSHSEYKIECRALWPDGSEHWIASNGCGYYDADGRPLRMEGVTWDITPRMHAQLALREVNEGLEHKVAERTALLQAIQAELRTKNEELRGQNQRVQEATRLKSEFLANMSHELRTPLNAIIGFSELMHDGKVGPVSTEHKEYLGDVLISARHLLQLINDVLDLAKVEAGKLEFKPEPIDLAKTLGEVRDVVHALILGKHLRVMIEIDPTLTGIVADAGKLKQVLYNYLSNAIKFSHEAGAIGVRVRPEGPRQFRLEVEDHGVGIKGTDIDRLFGEFQQLDTGTTKRYAGTGLGLALTKRVVEAQSGCVGVTSEPGKGSVFYAVLPRILTAVTETTTPPRRISSTHTRGGNGG